MGVMVNKSVIDTKIIKRIFDTLKLNKRLHIVEMQSFYQIHVKTVKMRVLLEALFCRRLQSM